MQIRSNSRPLSLPQRQLRRHCGASSLTALSIFLLTMGQCTPSLADASNSGESRIIGSGVKSHHERQFARKQSHLPSRQPHDSLKNEKENPQAGDFAILRLLEEARLEEGTRSEQPPRIGMNQAVRRMKKSRPPPQPAEVQEVPQEGGEESGFPSSSPPSSNEPFSLGISAAGLGNGPVKGINKGGTSPPKNAKSNKGKGSKGSKGGKGNKFPSGKGKGNVFVMATPAPSYAYGSPTLFPGGGNNPSAPHGIFPHGGSGGTPTVGVPTVSQPSTPSSPVQAPPSNREPPTIPPGNTVSPTVSPVVPRCTIGGNGLFGSKVGLSHEEDFAYQMQVIPSVTAGEINLNILPNIEMVIGDRVIERLFPQCSMSSSGNGGYGSRLRQLQTVQLVGFSTRPRDTVIDGVSCVNVEQVYPCFVIQGRVTTYTEQPITAATIQRVEAALQAAIQAGGIGQTDTRVIAVTWRDLKTNPIPGGNNGGSGMPTPAPVVGTPSPNSGSVPGTSSPNASPVPGTPSPNASPVPGTPSPNASPVPGTPSPNASPVPGTPSPNAGTVPIVRVTNKKGNGLQNWAIALIAVGGALFLCMTYLCLRRGTHDPIYDDEGGPSDGSEDGFADKGQKKENTPLVTPVYEPPQPQQQKQSGKPSKDPYRDPYMLSKRDQFQNEGQAGRASRASSEGSPIEEESDEDNSDDDDEEEEEDEEENSATTPSRAQAPGMKAGPSGMAFEQSSQDKHTAQDNSMVSPFGKSQGQGSASQWDEKIFNETTQPPMESTSEEFSSEYSEEEVEEEYEIEYVEDEEGLDGVAEEYDDDDEEEEESFSDEDDDEEDEEEIVMDEPGRTPILPWLAQDEH